MTALKLPHSGEFLTRPSDILSTLETMLSTHAEIPLYIHSQGLICIKLYYHPQKSAKRFWGRIIDARKMPSEKILYHFDPLAIENQSDRTNFRFAMEQIPLVFDILDSGTRGYLYRNRQLGNVPSQLSDWETAHLDFDVKDVAGCIGAKLKLNRILREQ